MSSALRLFILFAHKYVNRIITREKGREITTCKKFLDNEDNKSKHLSKVYVFIRCLDGYKFEKFYSVNLLKLNL